MQVKNNQENSHWSHFSERHTLTPLQLEQYKHYYSLVVQYNELFNLTAITQLNTFISHHLDDALALGNIFDMATITTIADIGAGAGIPSIPLKIKYPHLVLTLIEVNHKKIHFLEEVAKKIGLSDIFTSDYDWRTFLRKIDDPIDLFCARASLHPEELLRMFKQSSPYRQGTLVYWASSHWASSELIKPYIMQDVPYKIAHKRRRLVVFKQPSGIE